MVQLSITFGILHYFPISLLLQAFQLSLLAFYFPSLQQYQSYNFVAFSIAFCLECLSHLTFSLAQHVICLLNIQLLFSPIVTVSLLTLVWFPIIVPLYSIHFCSKLSFCHKLFVTQFHCTSYQLSLAVFYARHVIRIPSFCLFCTLCNSSQIILSFWLACENIRFSSLFAAGDVSR